MSSQVQLELEAIIEEFTKDITSTNAQAVEALAQGETFAHSYYTGREVAFIYAKEKCEITGSCYRHISRI